MLLPTVSYPVNSALSISPNACQFYSEGLSWLRASCAEGRLLAPHRRCQRLAFPAICDLQYALADISHDRPVNAHRRGPNVLWRCLVKLVGTSHNICFAAWSIGSSTNRVGRAGAVVVVFLELERRRHGTPLFYAVLEAHEEIVEFLIGKGADVNQKYLHGYSMLDDAVKSGRKGIAKKLLRGGLEMSGVG